MELVPIVDEDDNFIEYKDRTLLEKGDITRISSLWLTDQEGNVLLAQRALHKFPAPGLWGVAAAGAVSKGEEYDTNALNETREEIGLELSLSDLTEGPKVFQVGQRARFFNQWYLATIAHKPEKEFTIQVEEVAQVKWRAPEDIKREITETPEKFTMDHQTWLEHFLK